jgi:hypothetical protein
MGVVVFMVLAVGLWPSRAQTLTVILKPLTPFTITWDQPNDGTNPSFRLWCDGAIVKNYAKTDVTAGPVNADGSIQQTATAPGLPAGQHSCFVSAFNDVGEAKGEPIPVSVGTLPATPIRLKIVVTVGGG